MTNIKIFILNYIELEFLACINVVQICPVVLSSDEVEL